MSGKWDLPGEVWVFNPETTDIKLIIQTIEIVGEPERRFCIIIVHRDHGFYQVIEYSCMGL